MVVREHFERDAMGGQFPERVAHEPPGDFGADALAPPLSLQGDTKRAFAFPCASGDQADVANERSCLLIFHYQPEEPREFVAVGRGSHLLDPLLPSRRDVPVVGESERLDFRIAVQVKEEAAVARLEGAQDRPLRFE